jgi:SNF family Na+-dependent transporter
MLENAEDIISDDEDEKNNQRDRFGSDFEYMLSILGFAAGYGSLWRFPYLIFKNGGGTFLIPYFILFITMALPMFYLETALG